MLGLVVELTICFLSICCNKPVLGLLWFCLSFLFVYIDYNLVYKLI